MKGNKEKFINLANKLHDDKYDYNKFEYVSSKTKDCHLRILLKGHIKYMAINTFIIKKNIVTPKHL